MRINTIGIIGAGIMGAGIAQTCAVAGLNVILNDIDDQAIRQAIKAIDTNLGRQLARTSLTAIEKDSALSRIKASPLLADLAQADFMIEAATERLETKQTIIKSLEDIATPTTIIATNTSSVSITKLARALSYPERFIGMHFFNPVPSMALVEVIRGVHTGAQVYAETMDLAKRMNKVPIPVKNSPGFIVNRLLIPMISEAIFLLQEGVAEAEDIDNAMKLGSNHPIGPLKLADMIGLDTILSVMEVLYKEFSESKYRPAQLLREMVDAGHLGRKTKRGFFQYS
ncbi:3-hydroxybutyryl-CoA dehydrogenase [Noviherbaspirillum sp. CPCC 100848]|uniref:3-hydroxybutyryl-CoA dehydrogenase n=1 Tax=Noviherbaspirillum album TaxID=3080276 RepID=A0ABU6JGB1_9BURK|nr:3-hydroxybutyryl-CoA dehydrogenase [Noviherbaspirillum sp. CPCC 100848]MEC4722711.1 3-hydroxybutyryl-CoA dehydrogenase [Noviherbaspirillum sp. CPCC 100848]